MSFRKRKQFRFVSNALPEDSFKVARFKGVEGISKLYEFDIILVSEEPDIDLKSVLQNPAVLTILRGDMDFPIHGILSAFEQLHEAREQYFYRAVLVPRLWQADLYHENQLFLDKTVPDIIEEILKQAGLTADDYELRLTRKYPVWEYICQFRETDFDFISRWMEREGIYYYFEQSEKMEKLIITDSSVSHKNIPGDTNVYYSPPSALIPKEEEIVRAFVCKQGALPKKVILKDYNYRKPSLELKAEAEVDPRGRGEVYFYGEHFKEPEQGRALANIRAEELRCNEKIFYGESTAPNLCPGFFFVLNDYYRDDYNQKYLVTEIVHEGTQAGIELAVMEKGPAEEENVDGYINSFTGIPRDVQYRPELKTEKPRFYGTMNAKVDAAGDGQYAEIDDQGRYKVILPFDLSGREGGKASRWIRMMQPYAGADYGMHFPLHKDAEVMLSFVDGDPDRPIINGSVPNPDTMSPVTAANQTQSMIRTAGGNELHFDDQKGQENVYLHAEKDHTVVVANDKNQSVGNNETHKVGVNRTKSVGVDETESIGANKTSIVGADQIAEIGANAAETVKGKKKIDVGKSIVFTSGKSITLQTGASTIHMNKGGVITISGLMITMASAVNCNVTAPITNISGSVLLLTNTGAVNSISGAVTRVDGGVMTHVGSLGQTEVVSAGPTLVKGGTVKIN